MKKLNSLLVFLLLLVANQLWAQSKAIINGKISKPLFSHVELAVNPNLLVPDEETFKVEIKDNSFRIEVELEQAVVAELLYGDEVVPLYLEPGYELDLRFNGSKFLKSLKYKGKGANENNYLVSYTTRFDEEEDYQVLPDNVKLKEREFTEFLNYRREDQLNSLEKYTDKKPVSETFKNYLLAEIEFSYAKDKLSYHPLRQRILQVALSKPSPEFYTFVNELDLQRSENLLSPTFAGFLRSYTAFLTQEAGYTDANEKYFKASFDAVGKQLKDEALLLAQAQIIKQSIQFGHLKYTEQMLEDFSSRNHDVLVGAYLSKLHNANKQFSIGSLAPNFALKNVKGDTVALSDFLGKLVYLNFWSRDCGLCQMEQPHLQQLITSLKGQKIVFLSVSMDENEEQWRKMVEDKGLQGEHLITKGMKLELLKQYNLKDAPAYFLIDEGGYFISLKARRPSDREAINDILQRLELRQVSLN